MRSVRRALVPTWILEQVLLVIILRIVPLLCLLDAGNDLLAHRVKVLLLDLLRHTFCDTFLFRSIEEDSGAIF